MIMLLSTSLPEHSGPIIDNVDGAENLWTFLTDLWVMACNFMSHEIVIYGTDISFTLLEALIGFTIVSILFYAVFRPLE